MDNHFDTDVAATYDDDPAAFDPVLLEATTRRLADLAAGGPALEFAIGTGRVALPLQARGVPVQGIEFSPAMIARLREKPGGDMPVAVGDMASLRVPGTFSLVYLVYNTINNLTTQAAQVACFRNAAAHLRPGGAFVVEVGVPGLQRLPEGERFVPFEVSEDHWGIDEYDTVSQAQWSHHLHRRDGVLVRNSVPFRYVWPSELDLMARIAGMELESRHADWLGTAFRADSTSHVSVWRKPG